MVRTINCNHALVRQWALMSFELFFRMETLEKSISRIMADKVYSSGEFKRERDNFYVSNYEKYHINMFLNFHFQNFPF